MDRARGLVEQLRNVREYARECGIACIRGWGHTLQAGTFCKADTGSRTQRVFGSERSILWSERAAIARRLWRQGPAAPLRHAPRRPAGVVV